MEAILITGVTGNVGSHVLFELLFELYTQKKKPSIYVVIRTGNGKNGQERLYNEVFAPALIPTKIKSFYKEYLADCIHVLEGDISDFVIPEKAGNQFTVYHLAASVNLGKGAKAKHEIAETNYKNTKAFFEIIKKRTKKLVFVSTAFSRGDIEGVITDDYHGETDFKFRNFYEEFKMKIEKEVLQFAAANNFECIIARPSVVSGRLLDAPKYVTNSYIVFYAIGAFFSKMKALYKDIGRVRIVLNPEGGLNIVPVDYVAKAIVRSAALKEQQINITLTKNVAIQYLLTMMFNKCGIDGLEFVTEEPKDKSVIEALFYKTVGGQLASYAISKKHQFESKLVRKLLKDIEEPDMTSVFKEMYDFAHNINFDNTNINPVIG
ncbi:SDR family oxidoreductase [Aquimarina agarilytica]|uniref:SDR family oxidoreductase n=1 Tax=Aquimarina agarilytica TaxID=1087449 RepID=UPI00028A3E87|nr:SDR family oxidoreductase [Aquimarina agarilytica]